MSMERALLIIGLLLFLLSTTELSLAWIRSETEEAFGYCPDPAASLGADTCEVSGPRVTPSFPGRAGLRH